jgi:dipeptidase E
MPGHIVAMGGFSLRLVELMLELTGRARPRLLYLPTAMGDTQTRIAEFYEWSRGLAAERDHLRLFGVPDDPLGRIAEADAILVSGGNTANMLAVWRVHGVDRALRRAWDRGAVIGGHSAGANCWFESSVTDSFGPELQPLDDGLGLLPGSFCPHFDGEPERRPTFTRLVREEVLPPGIACDDGAAAWFDGTTFCGIVAGVAGAGGYSITPGGESRLSAIPLP